MARFSPHNPKVGGSNPPRATDEKALRNQGLFTFGAPSMGAVLRVQVPPKGGHPDRSEPQLREGDRSWEGSGERNRGPMYKNRIRGRVGWGERANDREAPMAKAGGQRPL